MLEDYKQHLKEKARLTTEQVAGAFKIDEEKRQKMEQNHYNSNIKKLKYFLENGIVVEDDCIVKINGITKVDNRYYFVTTKGIYDCDMVLSSNLNY